MSEETKAETSTTPTPSNNDGGSKSETTSIIDRADNIAKRLEEANKKSEELISKQEAIAARMMLGGKAEAGIQPKTPEEIKKQEVAEMVKKTMARFGRK